MQERIARMKDSVVIVEKNRLTIFLNNLKLERVKYNVA